MGKMVSLHGGPWHGRSIVVPDEADHFHIQQQIEPTGDSPLVQIKEGTYSVVRGNPADFEWDGYVND